MLLWRLRSSSIYHLQAGKVGSVIQSESEGPRTRGWWHTQLMERGPSLKAWEPEVPVSKGRGRCISQIKQRANFPFLHFFVIVNPSSYLMRLNHIGEGSLFYSVHWYKCLSLPEMPSQTRPKLMFCQLFRHLLALSSWPIKLTIIGLIKLEDMTQLMCNQDEPSLLTTY